MSRDIATKDRLKHRYLEVTYYLPGDDQCKFYAVVTRADTPTEALEHAIEKCMEDNPNAKNVEEFMQRIISEKRAVQIKDKMANKSWDGWDFGHEVD